MRSSEPESSLPRESESPPRERARITYETGGVGPAVIARLDEWVESGAAGRIWQKDYTFWSAAHLPEITDRLGWLNLPDAMRPEMEELRTFAEKVRQEGFRHIVLLGMGGSSLAPEVYQTVFGNRKGYPRLLVLDSTHPDAVSSVENAIDEEPSLFIVASKSGTTIETLSFFRYFYRRLEHSGARRGPRFIAITDPGSPLEDLARERGFRRVFRAAPDVGGRYSALSHFGLVPAALIGVDLEALLESAGAMAARCRLSGAGETNPGLMLGAFLGESALAGRDKVTFLTSPSLAAFPVWLEQLIAESTGKDGKGIVPVVDEQPAGPDTYAEDRLFVYLSLAGEEDPGLAGLIKDLGSKGHPILQIEIQDKRDLAGEMFRWEMGVAAAGAVLGIHPFNQPDVQQAKAFARQAMSEEPGGSGDEVHTIPAGAGPEVASTLRGLLMGLQQGDYVGLQAYLAPSDETRRALQAIRATLRNHSHVATTAGFGPRFLHSTGQLHKGGPDTGRFIQVVDTPGEDLEIPETGFTFGSLISAQAIGDYQALAAAKRRAVRIDLGRDAREGLQKLSEVIGGLE